jgi:hypothetical protein
LVPKTAAAPRIVNIVSNLRAMVIFSLFFGGLPTFAGQPRRAYVRNVVSGGFVAFSGRREENLAETGLLDDTGCRPTLRRPL